MMVNKTELKEIVFSGKEIGSGRIVYGDLLHSPVTSEYARLDPLNIKNGNIYYIVVCGLMKQIDPESVRDSIRHSNLFKR